MLALLGALALLFLPAVVTAAKSKKAKAGQRQASVGAGGAGGTHKRRKPHSAGMRTNLPHGWVWPPSAPMRQEGQRCLRDLDRLGVSWKPAPATRKIVTPIVVEDMSFGGVRLQPRWGKGPYVMDCLLARALARSAGPALANMKVVELRFGQIYKYRQVAGKKGVLSRHSLGLAMDVYAFVTADGEEHVVQDGYDGGDAVLLEAEARLTESGVFRTLLTPGNDPQHHYDHFHFEARAAGDKVVSKPTRPGAAEADEAPLADVAGGAHESAKPAPARDSELAPSHP